jgi:hypothetical protein
MRLNEINQPSKKAIFEGLKSDPDQPFSDSTLMEIAESVSNFDKNKTSMTVDEAIEWLNQL